MFKAALAPSNVKKEFKVPKQYTTSAQYHRMVRRYYVLLATRPTQLPLCQLDPIAAGALGNIESGIRSLEQARHSRPMIGRDGDSDGGRDRSQRLIEMLHLK